jgi:hypothetical protein
VAISCTNDPRVETFALNVTHKGTAGLSFGIVGTDFNPPAKANNNWTVKVLDANGQPVKDAVLSFPKPLHPSDPWMRDHSDGALPGATAGNGIDLDERWERAASRSFASSTSASKATGTQDRNFMWRWRRASSRRLPSGPRPVLGTRWCKAPSGPSRR